MSIEPSRGAARISVAKMEARLPEPLPEDRVEAAWQRATAAISDKIIVLDDDPTGTQTVHSLPVYTSWDKPALEAIRAGSDKMVYILTNSRALTPARTEALHAGLARDLKEVFFDRGERVLLISRSDSTLRGHYPLETATLYENLKDSVEFHGELIIPYFLEGGRLTMEDTHYVREGEELVPAAETEFARDAAFGYTRSNLKEWVAEKTGGAVRAEEVGSISLEMIRANDIDGIAARLGALSGFAKMIVNSACPSDIRVFVTGLAQALAEGQYFLFRTAASVVQALGGIHPKPLLAGTDLIGEENAGRPGLIIAGSYVEKTSAQLAELKKAGNLQMVEFNVREAANPKRLAQETRRVARAMDEGLNQGRDVCVFTSRGYFSPSDAEKEDHIGFQARVSEGLWRAVRAHEVRPGFIIAKGGITSSDVAVKGLKVAKADIRGQILPGVPVWAMGEEARWPGISYVVFPGNVGGEGALKKALMKFRGNF